MNSRGAKVGDRFGKLVVTEDTMLAFSQLKSKDKVPFLCDCGNIGYKNWHKVFTGETKSCGCLSFNPRNGTNNRTRPSYTGGRLEGKPLREWRLWKNMFTRVCSPLKHPSYVGCSVSDNFHIYDYFYDWCHAQVGWNEDDWQLDKDIILPNNRVYHEDFCAFVPRELNLLLAANKGIRGDCPIGVSYCEGRSKPYMAGCKAKRYLGRYSTKEDAFLAYKNFKEARIKEVAEEYKSRIDPRVYDSLISYEVKIED